MMSSIKNAAPFAFEWVCFDLKSIKPHRMFCRFLKEVKEVVFQKILILHVGHVPGSGDHSAHRPFGIFWSEALSRGRTLWYS